MKGWLCRKRLIFVVKSEAFGESEMQSQIYPRRIRVQGIMMMAKIVEIKIVDATISGCARYFSATREVITAHGITDSKMTTLYANPSN